MQRPGGIKQTLHLGKEGRGLVDLGKRWGEQARSALWEDRGAGGPVKVCSDVEGLPATPPPAPPGAALSRPGCGGGRTSLMAPLPAPGRIIYFSNRGGRSRECPAFARSASRAEKRGGARSRRAAGQRGPGPRAGSAMLAVSLKWRLGVVRRRPKGTGPRG